MRMGSVRLRRHQRPQSQRIDRSSRRRLARRRGDEMLDRTILEVKRAIDFGADVGTMKFKMETVSVASKVPDQH